MHDTGCPTRRLAVGVERADGSAVGHRTGGHPDQLGLGFLQCGDHDFQVALVGRLVAPRVPVAKVKADHVPVSSRLFVRTQPVVDVLGTVARRPAIGGRVMKVELARQGGPQSLVVVPRNRVANEEITGELRVIQRDLIPDRLDMDFIGDDNIALKLANDGGPIDERLAILDRQQVVEQRFGLPPFFSEISYFSPLMESVRGLSCGFHWPMKRGAPSVASCSRCGF